MPPPPDDFGGYARSTSFQRVLADAIADVAMHGYTSRERIDMWAGLLRSAAEWELGPEEAIDARMRDALGAIYAKLIDRGKVASVVPGVSQYTLAMIKPQFRAELDRRILAGADLIKLNRRAAIEKTLQRFSGWSTSIPPGGDGVIDKRETKASIGKSVAQVRYEARRVGIDQAHKLSANLSNIVAVANGAIAAEWNSHWRQANYNYRRDHKDRDEHVYAIRGSWAVEQGLINKGAGYTDEMTAPGEEVFCRCFYRYITSLRRVPDSMLTRKGQEWLAAPVMGRRAA